MIDPTEAEATGLRHCFKIAGEVIEEIGWDKPAAQWTHEQAANLVEAIVTAWIERPPF